MTTTRPTSSYVVEFEVFYSTLRVLFFVGSRLGVVKFSKIGGISKSNIKKLKPKD